MDKSFFVKLNRIRQKDYFSYQREFKCTEFLNPQQIAGYQNQKLTKLITHCYENVPYYRRVFQDLHLFPNDITSRDDLHKLPILTKEILRKEGDNMFSKNYRKGKPNITSGSTGNMTTIYRNNNSKTIEHALFDRYLTNIGYRAGDKILAFWGGHAISRMAKLKLNILNYLINYRNYSTYYIDDNQLIDCLNYIQRNNIALLRGYASALYLLAKKANEINMHFQINAISPTAEQLFDFQRKEIVKAFGPNIFDQYGCIETLSLAFECDQHCGLHQAFEHSISEVINNKGDSDTTGELLITNLDNYTMPLLRYMNGDVVELSGNKCKCGRHSLLFKRIEGRSFDSIQGINGNIVHGGFFDDIMNETNILSDYDIKEIQIVQTQPDSLQINYVGDKIIPGPALKRLSSIYNQHLGNMKISFVNVDRILPTKAGKRKFVISYDEFKNGLV